MENLPDSPEKLRSLVMDLSKKLKESEQKNIQLESKFTLALEENRLLKLKLFGKKTEQYKIEDWPAQLSLFEGIEEDYQSEQEVESQKVEISSHQRKKKRHRSLPQNFSRHDIIHDLPESEKICGCGCKMDRIGSLISEKLHIEQPKLWVNRHVRYKYACKGCEGLESNGSAIKVAPSPVQLIPKSIASENLIAHIITSKFVDSLPLYRQEQMFKRYGIEIRRGTMSIWLLKVFALLEPLKLHLRKAALGGSLVHIDETHVQVLDEPGRKASSKSYMWVVRGGPPDKPVVFYHYSPSRSGDVAKDLLNGYEGVVQTDGYVGYDFLDTVENIKHAGCWAHVRRKFFDAKKSSSSKKPGKADKILRLIAKLYKEESKAQSLGLSGKELVEYRQDKSKPIIESIKECVAGCVGKIPPKMTLGKAFSYTQSLWGRLILFLDDPVIPLDNNRVENDIRPFVVGRKNWLFHQSTVGAMAGAMYYSLIQTAKANGLEPFQYLNDLLQNITKPEYIKNPEKLLSFK